MPIDIEANPMEVAEGGAVVTESITVESIAIELIAIEPTCVLVAAGVPLEAELIPKPVPACKM